MKYDENLQIVPDLSKEYPKIEEDGRVYIFHLKENLVWQDNTPLTTDDIIFTIKTIQNPDFKSPLRANWVGVEVEKINDLVIKFRLKKPYSAFLENCTLKILPKHIWQNVSAERFAFEDYNLKKPIGSGFYKLKEIRQTDSQIKSLTLVQNPLYFGEKPNISEIKFLFFNEEKDLIEAARQGKIKGLSSSNSSADLGENWQKYLLVLPRYFAVFFNQGESKILAEKEVRLALNYGTNKKEIVRKILGLSEESLIEEKIVHSPILPKIYGFNSPSEIYEFDLERAKSILEEAGFKDNNGIREKIIEKRP
ncbi:unnamed protein product, partial [marine sediment metagenome]